MGMLSGYVAPHGTGFRIRERRAVENRCWKCCNRLAKAYLVPVCIQIIGAYSRSRPVSFFFAPVLRMGVIPTAHSLPALNQSIIISYDDPYVIMV